VKTTRLAIAAAALIAAATPSDARIWMKANVLNKACQAATAEGETQCVNFIMGALNGIEIADTMGQVTPEQQRKLDNHQEVDDPPYRFICMPEKPELFPVINYVRGMMKLQLQKYPSDGEFPAANVVFAILRKAYPCDGTARR
jgi:hypothetical protein